MGEERKECPLLIFFRYNKRNILRRTPPSSVGQLDGRTLQFSSPLLLFLLAMKNNFRILHGCLHSHKTAGPSQRREELILLQGLERHTYTRGREGEGGGGDVTGVKMQKENEGERKNNHNEGGGGSAERIPSREEEESFLFFFFEKVGLAKRDPRFLSKGEDGGGGGRGMQTIVKRKDSCKRGKRQKEEKEEKEGALTE